MDSKLKYCTGCRDDFYNGHNELGVTRCWHMASAMVVKARFVPLDALLPHKQRVVKTLSCHRKAGHCKMLVERAKGQAQ
jgi:hypothetical protein